MTNTTETNAMDLVEFMCILCYNLYKYEREHSLKELRHDWYG